MLGPFFALTRLLLRAGVFNKEGLVTTRETGTPLAAGTSPSGVGAFAGRWSIEREIVHFDGLNGRLTGTATIAPSGPGLYTYDETGTLTLGDAEPLHATRRYLWRTAEQAIDVSFADGSPFHRIALGAFRPETVHLCPPDRYAVTYDFTRWPLWTSRWRVEGPRKDYVMTSAYAPLR